MAEITDVQLFLQGWVGQDHNLEYIGYISHIKEYPITENDWKDILQTYALRLMSDKNTPTSIHSGHVSQGNCIRLQMQLPVQIL